MTTFGTLFSGGELAGVGIRAAGLTHKWGIELDDAIASVARLNGFNVLTADILDTDPATMEPIDALHASPPCTRASNANQSAELNDDGTKEAPLDIALAEKVAEFIDVLRPRIFTLENVYQYRNFKAFGIITAALNRGGYFWDYDNVNTANFAVPQTRRRLILRAVHGALLPPLPAPEPWVGWYASIADLVPTLPDSKFAKWQEARLPAEMETCLIGGGNTQLENITSKARLTTDPAMTIFTDIKNNGRAFILSNAKTEYGDGIRWGSYWSCGNCNHEWQDTDKPAICPNCGADDVGWKEGEPAGTVTGESNGRTRSFILDCQKAGDPNGDRSVTLPQGDAPAFTVTGGKGGRQPVRAWLVGINANDSSGAKIYQDETEPAQTVRVPSGGRVFRAWLSQGRVVKLTPRALARLQSVPDNYILPDKSVLACRVIGNGVPPLLMQKIYRQLVG